jgi:hypothetical protein
VKLTSCSVLSFVFTWQFGNAGLSLNPHDLVQSDWFGTSFMNLRWPCIFKHQIQAKTSSCIRANTVSAIWCWMSIPKGAGWVSWYTFSHFYEYVGHERKLACWFWWDSYIFCFFDVHGMLEHCFYCAPSYDMFETLFFLWQKCICGKCFIISHNLQNLFLAGRCDGWAIAAAGNQKSM